jgi:hypothetical protein
MLAQYTAATTLLINSSMMMRAIGHPSEFNDYRFVGRSVAGSIR